MVSVFMVYHYNHLDYFTLEVRTDNFVVHFSSTILFLSFSFHRLYRNKIFRVIPSKKKIRVTVFHYHTSTQVDNKYLSKK